MKVIFMNIRLSSYAATFQSQGDDVNTLTTQPFKDCQNNSLNPYVL